MKLLILSVLTFLPTSVFCNSQLINDMTKTETFLNNYYQTIVPSNFKLKQNVQPLIPKLNDEQLTHSLEVSISEIISSEPTKSNELIKLSLRHCQELEETRKEKNDFSLTSTLIITFPEYLEMDKVALAPNPKTSKFYLNLNSNIMKECFSKIMLKGESPQKKSKVLLMDNKLGFLLVNGKGAIKPKDIYIQNLQIDYKKHPFMQGTVTSVISDEKIKVKLDIKDNPTGDSKGWLQPRDFINGTDLCSSSSLGTGALSYMSLFTEEKFNNLSNAQQTSIEKKKFTSPHTVVSEVQEIGTDEILVKHSKQTAAISKFENDMKKLIQDESKPSIGDKIVIFCNNTARAAMFRFENINNYIIDNTTLNSSLRAAVQAYNNEGSGSINKLFINKWHKDSSRIVNAKSGLLIGSNKGPLSLTNSFIARVFDDGVNVFSSDIRFKSNLTIESESPKMIKTCLKPKKNNGLNNLIREQDKIQVIALENETKQKGESGKLLGHLTVKSVEPGCDGANTYGIKAEYHGLSDINHFTEKPSSLIAFNSNYSNMNTIFKNNIVASNRHSAFVTKAPKSKVINNIVLLGDYYPIALSNSLKKNHEEGMIPTGSKIKSNFIDSRTKTTAGVLIQYSSTTSASPEQTINSKIEVIGNLIRNKEKDKLVNPVIHIKGLKRFTVTDTKPGKYCNSFKDLDVKCEENAAVD